LTFQSGRPILGHGSFWEFVCETFELAVKEGMAVTEVIYWYFELDSMVATEAMEDILPSYGSIYGFL
jgi:hypothetical protein